MFLKNNRTEKETIIQNQQNFTMLGLKSLLLLFVTSVDAQQCTGDFPHFLRFGPMEGDTVITPEDWSYATLPLPFPFQVLGSETSYLEVSALFYCNSQTRSIYNLEFANIQLGHAG